MTHDEYVRAVLAEDYPDDPRVPLPPPFVNDAGAIQNIVLADFGGAAVIESFKGAIRSDHYHRTDWHFLYVLSGEVEYFWRPVYWPGPPLVRMARFEPGEMFFTPPLIEHTVYFPIATTLLSYSRNRRDHDSHESDVVRVESLWRP
jgi:uncharacterized RmlC-like cupin family protein